MKTGPSKMNRWRAGARGVHVWMAGAARLRGAVPARLALGAALAGALAAVVISCGGSGGGQGVANGDPGAAADNLALVQGLQCTVAGASTGWCWQRPLPQGNPVLDISLSPSGHGWAVGEAGTILRTTDGGATWSRQVAPVTDDLVRVAAALDATDGAAQTGWASSARGAVVVTSDGGISWRAVQAVGPLGAQETVASLGTLRSNALGSTVSTGSAWVLTSTGARWSTTDGGATWATTTRPADVAGAVLSTPDGSVWVIPTYATLGVGYAAGQRFTRSADNGGTWASGEMPALASGLSRNVWAAQAVSAQVAFMLTTDAGIDSSTDQLVRNTRAWRTLDGGQNWAAFNRAPLDDEALGVGYQMRNASTLLCVAAGRGLNLSTDGGSTWTDLPLPAGLGSDGDAFTQARLLGEMAETGTARVLLQTQRGRRFYSANAGALWAEVAPSGGAVQAALTSLWFFDRREGLASSADGSTLRTLDGGRTWALQTQAGAPAALRFLPGSDGGWAVSGNGTLLRTADRGRTWAAPTAQLAGLRNLHFVDSQRGWAVTSPGAAGFSVFRSSDGGQSWQGAAGTSAYTGLATVGFAPDGQHGLAAGAQGQLLVSGDGGASWAAVTSGVGTALRALVWLADGSTALAVGEAGVVLRSTDQGRTWSRMPTPTSAGLNAVQFTSPLRGWAVGDGGTLLATRDGGLTWAAQATGTRAHLLALHFIDNSTGWAVGANGTVLVTINGGD